MVRILIAVIDDLFTFATESLLRPFSRSRSSETTLRDAELAPQLRAEDMAPAPALPEESEEDVAKVPSFKTVGDVFDDTYPNDRLGSERNTVMYVGATELSVFMNPTLEFDGVIGELSYGAMSMVLEQRGRWARIASGDVEGWVLREDLVDRAAHVYPRFVIGAKNAADDPNTHRVRALIGDLFAGGKAGIPLQAGEYAMYRLVRKGLSIDWPKDRPRLPGRWHSLLKGVTGVYMNVVPKTGSIMEYTSNDFGHLAYVEAVFPDETINISEANYLDSGTYNERVLTREEWRELHPVYIQVM